MSEAEDTHKKPGLLSALMYSVLTGAGKVRFLRPIVIRAMGVQERRLKGRGCWSASQAHWHGVVRQSARDCIGAERAYLEALERDYSDRFQTLLCLAALCESGGRNADALRYYSEALRVKGAGSEIFTKGIAARVSELEKLTGASS